MTDVASKAELQKLEKAWKAAQTASDKAAGEAIEASEKARDLAVKAADAYAAFDRQQWAHAQIELGIAEEDLDVDRLVVTSLPIGPTHDVLTDGTVTQVHPDAPAGSDG